MPQVVPLILAAALMPALRWLRESGRSVPAVLAEAGHSYLLSVQPSSPVPLLAAVDVMTLLERAEGPDIGLRMVTEASLLELAIVSRGILGARNPREAFGRVAMAIPYHCTHEVMAVVPTEDGVLLREGITVPMPQATRHVVDQYTLALIREVCAMTGAPGPYFSRVEMTPHPEAGLTHLVRGFGDRVVPSRGNMMSVRISGSVADRPFRKVARNRFVEPLSVAGTGLRGDGSLARSVRYLLPLLMEDDTPTLERLVSLSGMTRRTLQRRLSEEGTSFSDLFADVRQQEALRRLTSGGAPIGEVARQLGFSQQSALTRAMRRWTGEAPSKVRARTAS